MRSLFTLLVLAAGAALRLWFIHAHPQIQGDSLVYGDIATNWLTHGIYGHSVGHPSGITTIEPTLVRLPGYPAFLALCFALFGIGKLSRCVIPAGPDRPAPACSSPAWRGRSGGPRAARVALLLAALCPFTASYVASPLTETLSIFCVALGFHALAEVLDRPRLLWTARSFFPGATAALLRPDGALLAVVLWTALIVYGRNHLGFSPPSASPS